MEADPAVMSPVANSVIGFIEVLCGFFKEVNSHEKTMEQVLKPTFVVESAHPYVFELKAPVTITCKGAESFKLKYSSQSKFPPMDFMKAIRVVNQQSQIDLLRISSDTTNYTEQIIESKDAIEIQFDYADIKKLKLEYLVGHPAPECFGFKLEIKPSFGSELLTLNNFMDQILRSCSWLIGRFAYCLVRVKKVDKEADDEKNYKLLLQSKILSGCFQDRFLHLFSKRTIKKLQEVADITGDRSFLTNFNTEGALVNERAYSLSEDDETLLALLHPKRSPTIDAFVQLLQRGFVKTAIWGNVGGLIGEVMVRSAFAPIVKFSSLASEVRQLSELLQVELALLEQDAAAAEKQLSQAEKDQKVLGPLLENPTFDQIRKRWAIASRMRTFYAEMKKSISEALEKRRQKLLL